MSNWPTAASGLDAAPIVATDLVACCFFEGTVAVLPPIAAWHKADVQTALMNVRFEGNNGHDADATRCLLMTQSGHCMP
jgi:hypothetical protein